MTGTVELVAGIVMLSLAVGFGILAGAHWLNGPKIDAGLATIQRPEFPTYEPGVPVDRYPAGVETDMAQAVAISQSPAVQHAIRDQLAARRGAR